MENLKTSLKKNLSNSSKIMFLGVGSELRGDDAAGIITAAELKKHIKSVKKKKISIVMGDTAPENLTGQIIRFNPESLVIIDAADFGKQAGTVKIFDPDGISGVSFSTHRLPFKIMADYLRQSINCQITIIGIQAKNLAFATQPSKQVKASAKQLAKVILEVLG